MNKVIILDPAHGVETTGKRSPGGSHREYKWSRERLIQIYVNLLASSDIEVYAPYMYIDTEINRLERVKKYNDIAKGFDEAFVLSLHNDAQRRNQCDVDGWGKASGSSVWTSRGDDKSDEYATSLFNHLKIKFPNDKFRAANWLSKDEKTKDPDWEANFTILAGYKNIKPTYYSVLLEWRFQTNKEDVKKLMNKVHNEHFEDMITGWIMTNF